ncbi:MAG: hypothetical protein U5L09_01495 [Bacteroidales bacterium]|nr:hypothetical protein [Bacteroidales bacterium]
MDANTGKSWKHWKDIEDIKLYDEAKEEDDGARISLEDYLNNRNLENE